MATNEPEFDLSRTLVLEEIAMIVEEAKATGETLRVGYHAGMLTDTYPDSGLSVGRICDEFILAAAKAGVATEIYRDGHGNGEKGGDGSHAEKRPKAVQGRRKGETPEAGA